MGRKKYKAKYVDLRGRWFDNPKLVRQLIDYAKNGKDWTELVKPIICEDSIKIVGQYRQYKNPPDLRMANFNDSDIEKVQLQNTDLSKATLYRSKANGLILKDCKATETKWRQAELSDSVFINVDFHLSNFSHVDLSNAEFDHCNLSHCYFHNAILENVHFKNTNLRHSNLNGVNIDNSTFNTVKLYGSSLWDIKYNEVHCNNIDLSKLGDNSIISDDIRIAPLLHLLEDDKLVEVIGSLKSNTVVILGSDSESGSMEQLEKIGEKAKNWGFTPIIVKKIKEIEGESFTKKAIMYSLLAKFVIIENSKPSGHILEFNKVLELGCIVCVLQERGKLATWLLEENFSKYPFHLTRFIYDSDFEQKIDDAYNWCINQHKVVSEQLKNIYQELYTLSNNNIQ
jgi:uncharacterized protein YjbI with pentapeptide repeats